MISKTCPCGFPPPASAKDAWSPEWHRGHRDAHLAKYPNVDDGTRSALEDVIKYAEAKALGPVGAVLS